MGFKSLKSNVVVFKVIVVLMMCVFASTSIFAEDGDDYENTYLKGSDLLMQRRVFETSTLSPAVPLKMAFSNPIISESFYVGSIGEEIRDVGLIYGLAQEIQGLSVFYYDHNGELVSAEEADSTDPLKMQVIFSAESVAASEFDQDGGLLDGQDGLTDFPIKVSEIYYVGSVNDEIKDVSYVYDDSGMHVNSLVTYLYGETEVLAKDANSTDPLTRQDMCKVDGPDLIPGHIICSTFFVGLKNEEIADRTLTYDENMETVNVLKYLYGETEVLAKDANSTDPLTRQDMCKVDGPDVMPGDVISSTFFVGVKSEEIADRTLNFDENMETINEVRYLYGETEVLAKDANSTDPLTRQDMCKVDGPDGMPVDVISSTFYVGPKGDEIVDYTYSYAADGISAKKVVTYMYGVDMMRAEVASPGDAISMLDTYVADDIMNTNIESRISSTFFVGDRGNEIVDYTYSYAADGISAEKVVTYMYGVDMMRAEVASPGDAISMLDTYAADDIMNTNIESRRSSTFFVGGRGDEIVDYTYSYAADGISAKKVVTYMYGVYMMSAEVASPSDAISMQDTYAADDIMNTNIESRISSTFFIGEKGSEIADYKYSYQSDGITVSTVNVCYYESYCPGFYERAATYSVTAESVVRKVTIYAADDIDMIRSNNVIADVYYDDAGSEIVEIEMSIKNRSSGDSVLIQYLDGEPKTGIVDGGLVLNIEKVEVDGEELLLIDFGEGESFKVSSILEIAEHEAIQAKLQSIVDYNDLVRVAENKVKYYIANADEDKIELVSIETIDDDNHLLKFNAGLASFEVKVTDYDCVGDKPYYSVRSHTIEFSAIAEGMDNTEAELKALFNSDDVEMYSPASNYYNITEGTINWRARVNGTTISGVFDIETESPGIDAVVKENILDKKEEIRGLLNVEDENIVITYASGYSISAGVGDLEITFNRYYIDGTAHLMLSQMKNRFGNSCIRSAMDQLSAETGLSIFNFELLSYSRSDDNDGTIILGFNQKYLSETTMHYLKVDPISAEIVPEDPTEKAIKDIVEADADMRDWNIFPQAGTDADKESYKVTDCLDLYVTSVTATENADEYLVEGELTIDGYFDESGYYNAWQSTRKVTYLVKTTTDAEGNVTAAITSIEYDHPGLWGQEDVTVSFANGRETVSFSTYDKEYEYTIKRYTTSININGSTEKTYNVGDDKIIEKTTFNRNFNKESGMPTSTNITFEKRKVVSEEDDCCGMPVVVSKLQEKIYTYLWYYDEGAIRHSEVSANIYDEEGYMTTHDYLLEYFDEAGEINKSTHREREYDVLTSDSGSKYSQLTQYNGLIETFETYLDSDGNETRITVSQTIDDETYWEGSSRKKYDRNYTMNISTSCTVDEGPYECCDYHDGEHVYAYHVKTEYENIDQYDEDGHQTDDLYVRTKSQMYLNDYGDWRSRLSEKYTQDKDYVWYEYEGTNGSTYTRQIQTGETIDDEKYWDGSTRKKYDRNYDMYFSTKYVMNDDGTYAKDADGKYITEWDKKYESDYIYEYDEDGNRTGYENKRTESSLYQSDTGNGYWYTRLLNSYENDLEYVWYETSSGYKTSFTIDQEIDDLKYWDGSTQKKYDKDYDMGINSVILRNEDGSYARDENGSYIYVWDTKIETEYIDQWDQDGNQTNDTYMRRESELYQDQNGYWRTRTLDYYKKVEAYEMFTVDGVDSRITISSRIDDEEYWEGSGRKKYDKYENMYMRYKYIRNADGSYARDDDGAYVKELDKKYTYSYIYEYDEDGNMTGYQYTNSYDKMVCEDNCCGWQDWSTVKSSYYNREYTYEYEVDASGRKKQILVASHIDNDSYYDDGTKRRIDDYNMYHSTTNLRNEDGSYARDENGSYIRVKDKKRETWNLDEYFENGSWKINKYEEKHSNMDGKLIYHNYSYEERNADGVYIKDIYNTYYYDAEGDMTSKNINEKYRTADNKMIKTISESASYNTEGICTSLNLTHEEYRTDGTKSFTRTRTISKTQTYVNGKYIDILRDTDTEITYQADGITFVSKKITYKETVLNGDFEVSSKLTSELYNASGELSEEHVIETEIDQETKVKTVTDDKLVYEYYEDDYGYQRSFYTSETHNEYTTFPDSEQKQSGYNQIVTRHSKDQLKVDNELWETFNADGTKATVKKIDRTWDAEGKITRYEYVNGICAKPGEAGVRMYDYASRSYLTFTYYNKDYSYSYSSGSRSENHIDVVEDENGGFMQTTRYANFNAAGNKTYDSEYANKYDSAGKRVGYSSEYAYFNYSTGEMTSKRGYVYIYKSTGTSRYNINYTVSDGEVVSTSVTDSSGNLVPGLGGQGEVSSVDILNVLAVPNLMEIESNIVDGKQFIEATFETSASDSFKRNEVQFALDENGDGYKAMVYSYPAYYRAGYTVPAYSRPAYTVPAYSRPAYTYTLSDGTVRTVPAYSREAYIVQAYYRAAYTVDAYSRPAQSHMYLYQVDNYNGSTYLGNVYSLLGGNDGEDHTIKIGIDGSVITLGLDDNASTLVKDVGTAVLIDGATLLDVNGDGYVNSADFQAGQEPAEALELIDVNGDGAVDMDDISFINRMVSAGITLDFISDAFSLKGDVNGDGLVNSSDISTISRLNNLREENSYYRSINEEIFNRCDIGSSYTYPSSQDGMINIQDYRAIDNYVRYAGNPTYAWVGIVGDDGFAPGDVDHDGDIDNDDYRLSYTAAYIAGSADFEKWDINGDGWLNAIDYNLVYAYVNYVIGNDFMGSYKISETMITAALMNCDYNHDGVINDMDLVMAEESIGKKIAIEQAMEQVDSRVTHEGEGDIYPNVVEDYIKLISCESTGDGGYKVLIKVDELEFEMVLSRYESTYNGQISYNQASFEATDTTGKYEHQMFDVIKSELAELYGCDEDNVSFSSSSYDLASYLNYRDYNVTSGGIPWNANVNGCSISGEFGLDGWTGGVDSEIKNNIDSVKQQISDAFGIDASEMEVVTAYTSTVRIKHNGITIEYYKDYDSDDFTLKSIRNEKNREAVYAAKMYLSGQTGASAYDYELVDFETDGNGIVTFYLRNTDQDSDHDYVDDVFEEALYGNQGIYMYYFRNDIDGDGTYDIYEKIINGSISGGDHIADSDGDRIPDVIEEMLYGNTHEVNSDSYLARSYVRYSTSKYFCTDSDQDGIHDLLELMMFGDLTKDKNDVAYTVNEVNVNIVNCDIVPTDEAELAAYALVKEDAAARDWALRPEAGMDPSRDPYKKIDAIDTYIETIERTDVVGEMLVTARLTVDGYYNYSSGYLYDSHPERTVKYTVKDGVITMIDYDMPSGPDVTITWGEDGRETGVFDVSNNTECVYHVSDTSDGGTSVNWAKTYKKDYTSPEPYSLIKYTSCSKLFDADGKIESALESYLEFKQDADSGPGLVGKELLKRTNKRITYGDVMTCVETDYDPAHGFLSNYVLSTTTTKKKFDEEGKKVIDYQRKVDFENGIKTTKDNEWFEGANEYGNLNKKKVFSETRTFEPVESFFGFEDPLTVYTDIDLDHAEYYEDGSTKYTRYRDLQKYGSGDSAYMQDWDRQTSYINEQGCCGNLKEYYSETKVKTTMEGDLIESYTKVETYGADDEWNPATLFENRISPDSVTGLSENKYINKTYVRDENNRRYESFASEYVEITDMASEGMVQKKGSSVEKSSYYNKLSESSYESNYEGGWLKDSFELTSSYDEDGKLLKQAAIVAFVAVADGSVSHLEYQKFTVEYIVNDYNNVVATNVFDANGDLIESHAGEKHPSDIISSIPGYGDIVIEDGIPTVNPTGEYSTSTVTLSDDAEGYTPEWDSKLQMLKDKGTESDGTSSEDPDTNIADNPFEG